jgi:hypothetical protein
VFTGPDGDLPVHLASAFRRVLLAIDARRRIGERVPALGVLKAFSLRLPTDRSFRRHRRGNGPADSGDLATDLAGLFTELCEVNRTQDKYSCAFGYEVDHQATKNGVPGALIHEDLRWLPEGRG